jgi:hypothetical protein
MDKYSKDHLNDIENRKSLNDYQGYYIDKIYRKICYKNKNKVWMYAVSVKDKPGHVFIYMSGKKIMVNERAIAHKELGPFIPKSAVANAIISEVISNQKNAPSSTI